MSIDDRVRDKNTFPTDLGDRYELIYEWQNSFRIVYDRNMDVDYFQRVDSGCVISSIEIPSPICDIICKLVQDAVSSIPNLNAFSHLCHEDNKRWWHNPATGEPIERNIGEMLMLAVSELAEAMEGARKNLNDDKLPHRKMFEVEIADCLIRLFDLCGGLGLDIDGAFREKMEYNRNRVDHTNEARMEEGGKRF